MLRITIILISLIVIVGHPAVFAEDIDGGESSGPLILVPFEKNERWGFKDDEDRVIIWPRSKKD